MRWVAPFLVCLAACGGGGGGPLPLLFQAVDLALLRADIPTTVQFAVPNPLAADATVTLQVEPVGPFAPASGALPAIVGEGAALALGVVFDPPGPGLRQGALTLRFQAGSTTQDVEISLEATGELAAVAALTGALDFGDVLVGETRALDIVVRNPGQVTPVFVSAVSLAPAGFTFEGSLPATLGPGATRTFRLRYQPQAPASHDFAVTFFHDAPGGSFDVPVLASTTTWVPRIEVDYGSVSLGGGQTAWLELEVPPHAISLSLDVSGPNGATIGLLGLEGPGGKIYENASATGALLWTPGDGLFTATVPNSDRAETALVAGGGTYRFRLYLLSGFATDLVVKAIVLNRPGGVATGGLLHLNVFLAPGLGFGASEAPGETRLQQILAEANRVFSQQDLSLGSIRYLDLDDSAYNNVSLSEFGPLCQESAAAPETRLNLFFVLKTLNSGVVGVAAAVPGPARNGSVYSGVMVDYDFDTAATNGYVTAHEIGHYLGLFHTVEQDGTHDLIDDTADCPPSGTNAICTTVGNDYLMHWQVLSGDPVLTGGQGLVILGHPLMEPPSALGAAALMLPPLPPPPAGPPAVLPPGWCGTKGCPCR